MKSLEHWQQAYPEDWDLPSDVLYLNHGAFGLTPREVLADQRQWQARNIANPMSIDPVINLFWLLSVGIG